MRGLFRRITFATLFCCTALSNVTFAIAPEIASAQQSTALQALPTAKGPMVVKTGTSVTLRIKQAVTSRTAKRGDYFKIELVNDIWDGSNIAVPAGTMGIGQVVHSAPKGIGGRAGELIIAARYLEAKGRRIVLRKTKFSAAGSDNAGAAIATTMVAPAIGIFITGTSVDLADGSVIVAEFAEEFQSDASANNLGQETLIVNGVMK